MNIDDVNWESEEVKKLYVNFNKAFGIFIENRFLFVNYIEINPFDFHEAATKYTNSWFDVDVWICADFSGEEYKKYELKSLSEKKFSYYLVNYFKVLITLMDSPMLENKIIFPRAVYNKHDVCKKYINYLNHLSF
jgi:hypothetical protein